MLIVIGYGELAFFSQIGRTNVGSFVALQIIRRLALNFNEKTLAYFIFMVQTPNIFSMIAINRDFFLIRQKTR